MERKRLFIGKKTSSRQRVEIIKWAAQNNYDAVVFPLGEKLNANSKCIKLAKQYDLCIEAGGRDLSLLVPRRLFFFNRGLFRMEQGKRKMRRHFCPTNPKTTAIIAEHVQKLFEHSMRIVTTPCVFHLLPDEKHETVWCACPACRAFSPVEQNIIAVNTAADVLAKLDPDARLSYLDFGTIPEVSQPGGTGIAPRKNMFKLKEKV